MSNLRAISKPPILKEFIISSVCQLFGNCGEFDDITGIKVFDTSKEARIVQ